MVLESVRLAVVDNDGVALVGLCGLITHAMPQASVVWQERDGRRAIAMALDPLHDVDVLLVDMSLEGMSGFAVCKEIRERSTAPVAMLAITAFSVNHYAPEVAEAGMQGIVGKTDARRICEAVARVASGGVFADDVRGGSVRFDTVAEAMARLGRTRGEQEPELSDRERQIVGLYAKAMKPGQIALRLGVKVSTVTTELKRAQAKWRVRSRVELIDEWWRRQC